MRIFHVFACCAVLAVSSAAAPATPKKGDTAKGKSTFEGQCSVCHASATNERKMGPSLKNLFKNAKLSNGKKPTEANVRAKIDEGGSGMPAYKDMLSDEDKNDLIGYLKTL
ncbi:MAG TPA: cytochrome c [Bryobacteraceae bacterium]|nr:cytochrome c [Bryobacteraceae bacterium]